MRKLYLILLAAAMSRMPARLLGERFALYRGDDGAAVDDSPAHDGSGTDSQGDVRDCFHVFPFPHLVLFVYIISSY